MTFRTETRLPNYNILTRVGCAMTLALHTTRSRTFTHDGQGTPAETQNLTGQ